MAGIRVIGESATTCEADCFDQTHGVESQYQLHEEIDDQRDEKTADDKKVPTDENHSDAHWPYARPTTRASAAKKTSKRIGRVIKRAQKERRAP